MGDWTFDLFMDDMGKYEAKDARVYGCERKDFVAWFKNTAEKFKSRWFEKHTGMYDKVDGYIGDAFYFLHLDMDFFSDFYKDAYGQRPHLPIWFYIFALGFPQLEDTFRLFCASPIEDAIEEAKQMRDILIKERR